MTSQNQQVYGLRSKVQGLKYKRRAYRAQGPEPPSPSATLNPPASQIMACLIGPKQENS